MSFLTKLKNTLTGSWADVSVECPAEIVRGQPATIRVTATVKDEPIHVSRVYAWVQAFESVDIPNYQHPNLIEIGALDGVAIDARAETFDQEFDIAKDLDLPANSTHHWAGQITLPTSEQPTFRGRNARHDWQIFVGLKMPGNDPDTGWHEIRVK